MSQKVNLKLILTILLFTRTLGVDPLDLTFVGAKNLIFNSDSRWEFTIEYSADSSLTEGSVYYTSILYKESQTIASCEAASGNTLNCYINEEG